MEASRSTREASGSSAVPGIDPVRIHPTRALLLALIAAIPCACVGEGCDDVPKAQLVPGTYGITEADNPDLVGGTITLTSDTLTVNFERSTGPVEVVYGIGEQTY